MAKFENLDLDSYQAGLAGSISNVKLGEPRTPEQARSEELIRRQSWETGNADYAGRDAFKHIWDRIQKTLDD